ncbi:glycosyltransferase family 4 protein [Colwellia sp. D2M02]|nr:glycosyltransferase family 4 protein [Colwellia sp. D2M02]
MMCRVNLMISTDPKGQGGIATVVSGYYAEGLMTDLSFIKINTHSSSNKTKISAFIWFLFSLIKLTYYGVFYKLGVAHIHMASRGSYTRKSIILRICKFLGAKTIIHLHGAEFEDFYSKESSEKKQIKIRETFNLADKVVVLSSQWLSWINTIIQNRSKACIVYNAVPKVKLPKRTINNKNILFLGRLGNRKGTEDLIVAFSKISIEFPTIELHLGGDGDIRYYQEVSKKLGVVDQVKFLGWVAGDSKDECLANATIYCLPSYNEGFPMGVLEAMSAGIPVVASTAGGIPDAITNKKEGLLVKAGDVDALTEALRSLLSDEKLRAQYSDAAKIKYQENFSPDVIIPQLKNIYKELLDK